jgi:cytochrome c oxidase subunit 2
VLLAGCGQDSPSIFRPEGRAGQDIRDLAIIMYAILAGVLLTVWVWLALAIIRYRKRPEDQVKQTHGNLTVEIVWTLIPTVIVIVLFVLTVLYTGILTSSSGDLTFTSIGHQYWWEADYEVGGFVTANEMHVPVDHTTTVDVKSVDVIHSFWIPQMGGKVDMIPGHTRTISFVPTSEGRFLGECSEFCGHQHGNMRFLLFVDSVQEFSRWVARQRRDARPPVGAQATAGAEVIQQLACVGCHAVRGTPLAGRSGPDLTHVASRTTIAAVTLPNTPESMRIWLKDPQAVKPGNLMPTIPLTDQQLDQLVAYLEGLE